MITVLNHHLIHHDGHVPPLSTGIVIIMYHHHQGRHMVAYIWVNHGEEKRSSQRGEIERNKKMECIKSLHVV